MNWNSFIYFSLAAVLFWAAGAVVSAAGRKKAPAAALSLSGSLVFALFIANLWLSSGLPPMRTMGDTRLWYSFFISLVGLFVYLKWGYRWILPFSSVLATVFICVNIFKPQLHHQAMMPALQSPWFVPHVTVYMFAYSLMGAAAIFAAYLWWRESRKGISTSDELQVCDTLVRAGWGFLTLGICMGALWAKQAWGDYWTWDPKETWAAATWVSYLLYLHLRQQIKDRRIAYALLLFSFILLQMSWWGVNFLPSAQGASVHIY